MTKHNSEHILIPVKFIALAMHLIAVTMNYFSYHDNITAAYPSLSSLDDQLYIGARASFLACNTIAMIFLAFEIIVLFVGVTLFRERHNIVHSTLHLLGAMFWCTFCFSQWQFTELWAIWAAFSLLPLGLQILTIISTSNK